MMSRAGVESLHHDSRHHPAADDRRGARDVRRPRRPRRNRGGSTAASRGRSSLPRWQQHGGYRRHGEPGGRSGAPVRRPLAAAGAPDGQPPAVHGQPRRALGTRRSADAPRLKREGAPRHGLGAPSACCVPGPRPATGGRRSGAPRRAWCASAAGSCTSARTIARMPTTSRIQPSAGSSTKLMSKLTTSEDQDQADHHEDDAESDAHVLSLGLPRPRVAGGQEASGRLGIPRPERMSIRRSGQITTRPPHPPRVDGRRSADRSEGGSRRAPSPTGRSPRRWPARR